MRFTLKKLCLLMLATMLSACAPSKMNMRFYSLAHHDVISNETEKPPTAAPIAIEVLPINVPERLKRPQLVISDTDASQLRILEQARWSSPFNDELQDAFVSGMTNQLNAVDVSHGGRVANQPTYRIAIVLQQFSATPNAQVTANFGWTITRLDADRSSRHRSLSCQATISKTVGNDTDAVVKGVQETVADAIQLITANVNSLNSDEAAQCSR